MVKRSRKLTLYVDEERMRHLMIRVCSARYSNRERFAAILVLIMALSSCATETERSGQTTGTSDTALVDPESQTTGTIDTDYATLDSLIDSTAVALIREHGIKGISVGFVDAGNYRTERGFGNMDPVTLFPMASVTKVVTAAAILQLVQDEKLQLDDLVKDYLPGFDLKNPWPGSPEVKIRHLLTHTSGLSRDVMHLAQGFCPPESGELLDYITKHRQISPAGYRHSYSNPGFDLLGLVIEKVSGLPYPLYMRKNILAPLAMDKSFFGNDAGGADVAGSHTMTSDTEYREMPIHYIAAGGLKSNVHEMLHFAEMLLHGKAQKGTIPPDDDADSDFDSGSDTDTGSGTILLEEDALKTMFRRQNADVPLDTEISMGVSVFLEDLPPPFTGKMAYHGGGAIFSNSMLLLAPDYGLGVVVLSNTAGSYPMVGQLARRIIIRALEIKTGYEFQHRPHPIPEKASWSVAEQQKIIGEYAMPNQVIQIISENDTITAQIGGSRFPVTFFENGFFSYHHGFYLKADEIEEENVLFYLANGMLVPIGKKRDAGSSVVPERWKQAAGTYISVSPCAEGAVRFYESFRIYVQDYHLYAGMLPERIIRETFGITSEIPALLSPLDDTMAVMQDFGRYGAEPLILDTKNQTITFSGLTFQRLE